MSSSCSQSSYCHNLLEIHLNLSPKQTLQALERTHENMSHFPLSLIASSNLPSAMAVVTSLVWTGKKRQNRRVHFGGLCHSAVMDQSLKLISFHKNEYDHRDAKPHIWTNAADSPLAHTPWAAVWRPCFRTSWPHTRACLAWPPGGPSPLPPPSCWPEVKENRHTHFYLITPFKSKRTFFSIQKHLIYQDSVKGRRGSSSLYVTQDGCAGVKA